jgi:hypothetical protein
MAGNSFMLKGWSVTLVSALFALAAKDTTIIFVYLAYFPAVAFWILDGYFLWQERLFRKLYDHVRILDESTIDYSMNTKDVATAKDTWTNAMLSTTLKIFHGVIIGSIIVVTIILSILK